MQIKTAWQSPSNIAIVKYWGKYGRQLPQNTSLSFTLSNSVSKTSMILSPKTSYDKELDLAFYFEGKKNDKFGEKTKNFLISISGDYPFLLSHRIEVHTENTFPHSSGIASSASGMSALALCIIDVKYILENGAPKDLDSDFLREASVLARLGSGSACRSVYPIMSMWGKHEDIAQSSQEYGIAWTDVHEVFHLYHDDILIVSKDEKSVSSTAGHGLMVNNPYADARYQQAQDRITLLCKQLRDGDVHGLGLLAEDEAMTLHALMMCSKPSYVLMRPNTLAIIEKIRSFRGQTNLPLYFTLDAGPNVHLLYPDSIKNEVASFVNEQLISLCENNTVIYDFVGKGPERL